MKVKLIVLLSLMWVIAVSPARAADLLEDDARHLSFQARLTDGNGVALVGQHDLEFRIYNDPLIAVPVGGPYAVTVVINPADNGVVSVLIPGGVVGLSAALFDGGARYLGVSIDGGVELSPRIQIAVVPHAMRTNYVGNVELTDDVELGDATHDGSLTVYQDGAASAVMTINGSDAQLTTYDDAGVEALNAGTGAFDGGGFVILRQDDGTLGLQLDGHVAGQGGVIVGRTPAPAANKSYELLGDDGNGAGRFTLFDGAGGAGGPGAERVRIDASGDSTGAELRMYRSGGSSGIVTLFFDAADTEGAGLIAAGNDAGTFTVGIHGDGGDNGGLIRVRNALEQDAIILDAQDAGGNGRIITDIIEIKGGADFSENFEISSEAARPGMVVSIDPANPGKLVVSRKAYDRCAAGVVSGAGGVNPGMLMGQKGSIADGNHPVALSGRVYCMVDATQNAVEPGDLLTTSAVPGHAMKATDHARAQGAIIGKAMTPLKGGQGLVLVLVSLQ